MKPQNFRTRGGRELLAYGDASLLTLDRLADFEARFDSDPRIASVSLVASGAARNAWIRATSPQGPLVVLTTDHAELIGPLPQHDRDELGVVRWCEEASDRGLWHDWLVTDFRDTAEADAFVSLSHFDSQDHEDPTSSYATLRNAPSRRRGGMTVNVDATWLGSFETGAQVLTTAAVHALCRSEHIERVTLVGLESLPKYASHLADLSKVRLAAQGEVVTQADIMWFPNQIDGRSRITDARSLGRRTIVTFLDLIAYDIPRYHANPDAWLTYRALQRQTALNADGITTISADVAQRLIGEVPRLDAARVRAVPLGLDHLTARLPDIDPASFNPLRGRPFILVLGNDFVHKNRDFAIRVWQGVLESGISCDLVLAGLHVRSSSSESRESVLLEKHVNLRGRIHKFGHVSGMERSWLLSNAAAVLYPTSAEGFGLVPYEAAQFQTPATFADFGPLREISGVRDAPSYWSLDAFVSDLKALLTDRDFSKQRIDTLNRARAHHTWDVYAQHTLDHFISVLDMPTSPSGLTVGLDSAERQLAAVLSSKSFKIAQRLQRLRMR